MKNLQKGFVVPLLIAVIALLVIGGGIYVYENKKAEVPAVTNTGIQQPDQVQQQTNTQTPPITNQPLTVTLDLSSTFAQQFKTILAEAFKKTSNFDEHYVVAEIGCGTGCFTFVVIDKNTGKVYPAPIINDIGQFTGDIGQPYNLHSNQIKIIADNGSKINTYVFTGSGFSLLSSESSQSVVSTSNWKTYTNSQYGFSIQYPVGSQVNDEGSDGEGSNNVLFTLPKTSDTPGIKMFIVNMATKAWYNLGTPNGVLKSPPNCNDFNSNNAVTSSVNINGVDFIKGDVSSAATAQRSSATEYCVLRGETAYKLNPLIEYSRDDTTVIDVNKDSVLNQMVSTFKFIN